MREPLPLQNLPDGGTVSVLCELGERLSPRVDQDVEFGERDLPLAPLGREEASGGSRHGSILLFSYTILVEDYVEQDRRENKYYPSDEEISTSLDVKKIMMTERSCQGSCRGKELPGLQIREISRSRKISLLDVVLALAAVRLSAKQTNIANLLILADNIAQNCSI